MFYYETTQGHSSRSSLKSLIEKNRFIIAKRLEKWIDKNKDERVYNIYLLLKKKFILKLLSVKIQNYIYQ